MPLGIAKTISWGGGGGGTAPTPLYSKFETNLFSGYQLSGDHAFEFAGFDVSNNPVFLIGLDDGSTYDGISAVKFNINTEAWSTGTVYNLYRQTGRVVLSTKSRGALYKETPQSGATLTNVGVSFGGVIGDDARGKIHKHTLDTSTLALTNTADLYVQSIQEYPGAVLVQNKYDIDVCDTDKFIVVADYLNSGTTTYTSTVLKAISNVGTGSSTGHSTTTDGSGWTNNDVDYTARAVKKGTANARVVFSGYDNLTTKQRDTAWRTGYAGSTGNSGPDGKHAIVRLNETDTLLHMAQDVSQNDLVANATTVAWSASGNGIGPNGTKYTFPTTYDGYNAVEGWSDNTFFVAGYNGTALKLHECSTVTNNVSIDATRNFTLDQTPNSPLYQNSITAVNAPGSDQAGQWIFGAYSSTVSATNYVQVWGLRYNY